MGPWVGLVQSEVLTQTGGYLHNAARWLGGFRGIDDEVHDDLLQLTWIGGDERQILRRDNFQGLVLGDGSAHQGRDAPDLGGEIDGLDQPWSAAGIGQHLSGQLGGALAGLNDRLHDTRVWGWRNDHFPQQAG